MYRQDAFVCMQPAFSRAAESNSCALSSLWKAKWRKEFIWFAILRGGSQDIPQQGASNTSRRYQTGVRFWLVLSLSSGADVAYEGSGGRFDCTPRTAALQSFPIKLFNTRWLTHPPACPPAVKPSRQWFLTFSASITLVPLRLSPLSKPTPAAHRWNSSKSVSTNPGSLVHLSERSRQLISICANGGELQSVPQSSCLLPRSPVWPVGLPQF